MKVRIDRTRRGRKWERVRAIQICKDDGTRIGEIILLQTDNRILVGFTKELDVRTHLYNGLGGISIGDEEAEG